MTFSHTAWQNKEMENSGFFKVRINTLVPGKPLTFDLHLRINNQHITYVRAGDRLESHKIQALEMRDSGNHFWVKDEDRKAYKQYVHDQMISSDLNVREKALLLRESSMTLVEELFEHPDVNKSLDSSRPIITQFVEFMKAEH